jgi:glycosyltransferase involved in cell wall biosynthesis
MRFHVLGFPHTFTHPEFTACAYTEKLRKFIKMMAPRGHELIHYGNEGSVVDCEPVEILTEIERASFFGGHDRQKLYDLQWDPKETYWRVFNQRAVSELKKRVRRGDFILSLAGNCHQPIAEAFPGSFQGPAPSKFFVEFGIGYYGTFSRYRVYESETHRSWCMGRADYKSVDYDTAVVNNYWDMADFPRLRRDPKRGDFYLFMGRIIDVKGWHIAVEVTQELGANLVLAGQGAPANLPPHVRNFGHATAKDRNYLMTQAIATFAPTQYLEPFGGVAVEAQLCGTPCITSDAGVFPETVAAEWRCASHREYLDAAKRALQVTPAQRTAIRKNAVARWSLGAIAPQYERYFQRLQDRFGAGYYAREPFSH